MGGERPHDVTLGDDAVDVPAVGGHDERTDAQVARRATASASDACCSMVATSDPFDVRIVSTFM